MKASSAWPGPAAQFCPDHCSFPKVFSQHCILASVCLFEIAEINTTPYSSSTKDACK